ncbi:MmpS family transport accessory protein [Actinomadura rupiterrae]|uniref:MmpS family transport accessory protein n=1 Tax=Actinomadura rupiterrae TaxID=559627 RepID=UPI0020A552B5|nr:MmpS family transport accessory protein [Actinomadura rupiterrae]MCP2343664.1 hypothetical protein [Actinomadura rupiterrae]
MPAQNPPAEPAEGRAPGMSVPAVLALVLSVLWLCGAGSVLAILLGITALFRIRRTGQAGRGLAVAGIVLGVLGVVGAAGGMLVGIKTQEAAKNRRIAIILEGSGSGGATSADITYAFGSTTSQAPDAALPWRRQATADLSGLDVVQVIVRNRQNGGSVTCRITVDGRLVKSATVSGGQADAACVYDSIDH